MDGIEDDFWLPVVKPVGDEFDDMFDDDVWGDIEEVDDEFDADPMCVEDGIPKDEGAIATIAKEVCIEDVKTLSDEDAAEVPSREGVKMEAFSRVIPDELYFGISPTAFFEMMFESVSNLIQGPRDSRFDKREATSLG
jgi:hypothetical protein